MRVIHKWLSLLVGLQLLIWLVTGLYFNLMDREQASGNQYRIQTSTETKITANNFLEPIHILQSLDKANTQVTATDIALITLLDTPYYLITHQRGLYRHFVNQYSLFNAYTGQAQIIDKAFAMRIAQASYSGPGVVTNIRLEEGKIEDFPKQRNAAWRIDFNDEVETSVYIEAGSGRLVGHSNSHKRFAGIFYMLHFMDYNKQGGFNAWWVIGFAFLTLMLSISGVLNLVDLIKNHQFRFPWSSQKHQLNVIDNTNTLLKTIDVTNQQSLLTSLHKHAIELPSSCGGGGTCGTCCIKMPVSSRITTADREQFSQKQLANGYRLGCQHYSDESDSIQLLTR